MLILLLIYWQNTVPAPAAEESKSMIAVYVILATIAGGMLKSFFDWITNKDKTRADISLTGSQVRLNENEIEDDLQNRLFNANRLLMEMQEKLDKWIKRFEETAEEASNVEDELRKVRRDCQECMEGRRSYVEVCQRLNRFFDRIEPLLIEAEGSDSIVMNDMIHLKGRFASLQADFERSLHPKEIIS